MLASRWKRYAHLYDHHGGPHQSISISNIARKKPKYITTKLHMNKIQSASTQMVDSQIGAAAYCPVLGETKQPYLGLETLFNIYVAKVTAMTLAVEIL